MLIFNILDLFHNFRVQQLNQYLKHETFAFQTLPIQFMPHRGNTSDSTKYKKYRK